MLPATIPPKYRRLWKRRLRRRPLLPFLLAATLAVDIALLWSGNEGPFITGAVAAQIALLGVWVTWSPRLVFPRALAAFLLIVLGLAITDSLAVGQSEDQQNLYNLPIRAIGTAVVFASLGATIFGAAAVRWIARLFGKQPRLRSRRRFGIGTLLWLTTLIAMVIAFGRYAAWPFLAVVMVLLLVLAEAVVVAIALGLSLVVRSRTFKPLLLVWAPLLSAILGAVSETHMVTYYSTQLALIGGWLIAIEPSSGRSRVEAAEVVTESDSESEQLNRMVADESPKSIDLQV